MAIFEDDLWEGFSVFAGKREVLEKVYKEIIQAEGYADITTFENKSGNYGRICVKTGWGIDIDELMKRYPSVEGLICRRESVGGYCSDWTHYSKVNSTEVSSGILDDLDGVHLGGYALGFNITADWDALFFRDSLAEGEIKIVFKDGEEEVYEILKPLSLFDELKAEGLTLGFLANIVCCYVESKKEKEFVRRFCKRCVSIENILQIHVRYKTAKKEIPKKYLSKLDEESTLDDESIAYFLGCHVLECDNRIYDFADNTVTGEKKIIISVPKNVQREEYEYIKKEVDSFKWKEEIAGYSHNAEFWFSRKEDGCVCELCLSDFPIITVPEEDSNNRKVEAIGDGCFRNCPSVEKIILPNSVTIFGENCFAGMKNLESVTYQGKEGKEEIELVSRKKLTALVTMKSSYEFAENITTIGNYALSGSPKLKSITLHKPIKLLNHSLSGCKTLKTVILSEGIASVNVTALQNAKIKELILPDGKCIKLLDECLYECIEQTNDGIGFSYIHAAENLSKISAEAKKYRVAVHLLKEHNAEIGDMVSDVMDCAVRYCILKEDKKSLSKLFDLGLKYTIDFAPLIDMANNCTDADISEIIVEQSEKSKFMEKHKK